MLDLQHKIATIKEVGDYTKPKSRCCKLIKYDFAPVNCFTAKWSV